MDGTKEFHNATRLRINKSGSFDKIWENLLAMRDSNLEFSVMLRIHITPENYESLFCLIDDLENEFSNDKRFQLFFKTIADLGGPNSKQFLTLKGQDKETAINNILSYTQQKISIVSIKNKNIPYVCYAAQANSFMIRANGSIGKCTVALNDARNCVGKLFKDGTIELHNDKMAPWLRGIATMDTKVLHCPLRGMPK